MMKCDKHPAECEYAIPLYGMCLFEKDGECEIETKHDKREGVNND